MEKREYMVYKWGELPKEAREAALEKYRYINVEDEWNEDIKENYIAKLVRLGYRDVAIMFSGFASQGDGACFTAQIDMGVWLKAHKLAKQYRTANKTADEINARIVHNDRYYHARSSTVYVDVSYGGLSENNSEKQQNRLFSQMAEIEDLIIQEREKIGDAIYKELEKRYYILIGDIEVEDTLIANDYSFTIDGEID